MYDLNQNHLWFEDKDDSNNLVCCWTMDKITYRGEKIWLMNHFFVNPQYSFEESFAKQIKILQKIVTDSHLKIWPLDPLVISYLSKHIEYNYIWEQKPSYIKVD